ncbi:hypothetical protein HOLleu_06078 [Holothuria leucospilota]|uniref:Uncharacterized protein n=1 Tax=Holothuria leucospilota TaxID=206669 RepID=A0A9Q1HEX5_HOLLE|nr:hypothetical protein HOLleu_06078 [Holothuria leucospilota]
MQNVRQLLRKAKHLRVGRQILVDIQQNECSIIKASYKSFGTSTCFYSDEPEAERFDELISEDDSDSSCGSRTGIEDFTSSVNKERQAF